ncbi:hypothetical protein [Acinetobacter pittii]|uniref:hypothetical protein n=1 Tax=Acinetobacter pittii TaxID=48296 RepID=UPI000A32E558|nr:hypothetical protein [Acinetobacter pittii]OTL21981.1 hypothetical protein B9X79_01325 [Acinetobacter pittii]TDM62377.1 hypothetical protein C5B72_13330 [Acinetobacter sp. KU 011TH]TDM62606.1 hypothetical protein C4608_13340 [Acinetobacter sp. KU 013TH]
MQTNLSNQTTKDNLQEQKRQQIIQSWYEPALKTLDDLLEKRRENLRNQNREEKNAAVKRDEFMQALSDQHRMPLFHAGQIISSLYRAKRIRYLGSTFIQLNEEGDK